MFAATEPRPPAAKFSHDAARPGRRALIVSEHLNATYFISFHFALMSAPLQNDWSFASFDQAQLDTLLNRSTDSEQALLALIDKIKPSVAVFTRCSSIGALRLAQLCRRRSIPAIYHIDDDLLQLPASLGTKVLQQHGSAEVIQRRTELIRCADLVYASTAPLTERLQARFPEQRFVTGMYAPVIESVFNNQRPTPVASRSKVFGYMGSKGHAEDLALVVPAIARVLDQDEEMSFELFGTIPRPAALERFGDRIRSLPVKQDYLTFLDQLSGANWRVGLAPLVNSPFNGCKANTKFVEYSTCGIPTLASRVPVYQTVDGRGELVADDEWERVLLANLYDSDRLEVHLQAAREFIASEYPLARLQNQLREIFAQVLNDQQQPLNRHPAASE